MDRVKQWVALAVAVSLGVLAAGWFLLVQPKNAEAADLRAQAEQQVSANAAMRTHLAVLKAQARDLPKQEAKLARVSEKIPDNPALPALIRALAGASDASGVEFLSLTPGAPTPAATTGTTGQSGLTLVPVTINVSGGYFQIEQYVRMLEDLPRALRISNITVAPGVSPVAPQSETGTGATSSDTADTDTAATDTAATDGSSLVTVITGSVFLSADGSTAAGTASAPITASTTATTVPSDDAPAS